MSEDLIKNTVEEDNKEILSALRCGALTDCIDEVQKSRDRLEQGDLIFMGEVASAKVTHIALFDCVENDCCLQEYRKEGCR